MSDRPWRRVFLVLGVALLLGAGSFAATAGSGIDVYSGGIDMHSTSISNLADPSSAQDAATRSWVNTNDDDASTSCTGSNFLAGDGTCNADSYEADTNTNSKTICTGDDYLDGDGNCVDEQTIRIRLSCGTAIQLSVHLLQQCES